VSLLVLVSAVALGTGASVAFSDDDPQPIDFTHNAVDAPAPVTSASGPADRT
jgi:hypothetical protein